MSTMYSPTPQIPPHPDGVSYIMRDPNILESGPRKKRIQYRTQEEKREALRARSRDNRRKAKEKKQYMDGRIEWLHHENPQIQRLVQERKQHLESLKERLQKEKGINWNTIPFYVNGGAEALFEEMELQDTLLGEIAPTPPAESQQDSPKAPRKKKAASSKMSKERYESIDEEELSSNTSSATDEEVNIPPPRLTRAQKRKREEELSQDGAPTGKRPTTREE